MLLLASSSGISQPVLTVPRQVAGPVGAPAFGINSHLATRYPDPTSMGVAAGTVANLGVSWVREDFHWHRVQPAPDVWDWTFTDAALRELLRRDIEVLGVLGPSVGWATPYRGDTRHDVSFYAPDPQAFANYARAVVRRYHHYVDHWEIWNEPDNPLFWQPEPDPAAYAELLMRTSAAIKEVDPDAQVLIGGLNPFDTTFARTVAEAGAWDSFDILAVHPYVDPYTPEAGNLSAALDKLRVLAYRFGHKPIWATEIGWSSGPGDRDSVGLTDEEEQAQFLVRSLLLLWTSGVERSFWYMLKDDAHNPYGLVAFGNGRTDFRSSLRKPAFSAFRTLNNQLDNTQFVEQRNLLHSESLLAFAPDDDAWQRPEQPNGSLRLHEQELAQVRYNFSTDGNDYLVFERAEPVLLSGRPHALGLWVYGNGTAHDVRIWLRDAEGEVLQYTLGIVGTPGWSFISAPLTEPVAAGNRITDNGNGRLDMPASFSALVFDDAYDAFVGTGTIYLDELTALYGHEVYNVRLARGSGALDIVWAPSGVRATLNTRASSGQLVQLQGNARTITATDGRFVLDITSSPMFLWHQRPDP
jgi:hypothetical protein